MARDSVSDLLWSIIVAAEMKVRGCDPMQTAALQATQLRIIEALAYDALDQIDLDADPRAAGKREADAQMISRLIS